MPGADRLDPRNRAAPARDDHRLAPFGYLLADFRESRFRLKKANCCHLLKHTNQLVDSQADSAGP